NGSNQLTQVFYNGGISWLRLNYFYYKWGPNYFGLDSLQYVLTDNGSPTGFDTATIYIYVKRKEYENLDINNVNALVDKEVLFHNKTFSIAAFSVPKQNDVNDPYYSTIYAANFWIAGIDQNGTKKGYSPLYFESFELPFFTGDAGPLMDSNSYEKYSYEWDRVWKVSQTDIDYHIANYTTGGYQAIEVIENWPAHGDTSKGQAFNLAPFVDVDLDGVYNPMNGDYPKIKGQQAVYFIKNDERIVHNYTPSPLGIEIHGMAYAYDCSNDSAINNTIFLDYKVYNRSAEDYHDVYMGFWADMDIGNSSDDYIGCDISRGAFYGYNGDGNDEDANGISGYDIYPAAQSVVFLKGPKKDNDGMDNPLTTNIPIALSEDGIPYAGLGVGYGDSIIDNEYLGMEHFMYYNIGAQINGNGDPNNANDFYNYLTGKWTNGNQMIWGGDGNPLGTGTGSPAKYIFPGITDPLFWGTNGVPQTPSVWDEASIGNTPGDRRGVGSTGPFTFSAGTSTEMTLAFVFGRDYNAPNDNLAPVVVMQERIDSIRSYFLNDFQSVCGGILASVSDIQENENRLQVYPNPFNEQVTVFHELKQQSAQLKVFNLFGEVVVNQMVTQTNTIVDLSQQAKGIYFIQIIDGSNKIIGKIIKQ
ncbi:MAG: T9SS type A sorting domain-containing protein, partial [Flavobacteriales bacterium]|nr:T9SS type A sorting domain-containing protein [Flavobacteriales bacterium]